MAALLLPVPGCTPSLEPAAREAAEPEAVAAAICREVRADEAEGCEGVRLSDRASEIAYATCLDYNRRDLRGCDRLRRAYEDAIRAQLGAQKPPVETSPSDRRRTLAGSQNGAGPRKDERQPPAEALYKAANSDADTFQAALLIPDVRKKIEAALGKPLSDAQLRALIDNNRTEAVYWYDQMRHPRPAPETAPRLPGG